MCDSLSINHTPANPSCQATRIFEASRPKIIDSDKRVRGNSLIPFGQGGQNKYWLKMSESSVYLKPFENANLTGKPRPRYLNSSFQEWTDPTPSQPRIKPRWSRGTGTSWRATREGRGLTGQTAENCGKEDPMFKKLAIGLTTMFGVVLLAASLHAQEFSADVIVKGPDGKVQKGKFYHTANKDRYDSSVEKKPGTVVETHLIIDRGQNLIYLVEPQQKLILVNYALQALGNPAAGGSGDNSCAGLAKALGPMIARQGASGCKQVGSENVNGRSTVKWEMHMKVGAIQLGTATTWVDSQLKTSIKWQFSAGDSGELQNIQPGAQPASLFVLPADYRRQDLPGSK